MEIHDSRDVLISLFSPDFDEACRRARAAVDVMAENLTQDGMRLSKEQIKVVFDTCDARYYENSLAWDYRFRMHYWGQ